MVRNPRKRSNQDCWIEEPGEEASFSISLAPAKRAFDLAQGQKTVAKKAGPRRIIQLVELLLQDTTQLRQTIVRRSSQIDRRHRRVRTDAAQEAINRCVLAVDRSRIRELHRAIFAVYGKRDSAPPGLLWAKGLIQEVVVLRLRGNCPFTKYNIVQIRIIDNLKSVERAFRRFLKQATESTPAPFRPALTPNREAVLSVLQGLPPGEGRSGQKLIDDVRRTTGRIIGQSVLTSSVMPVLRNHYYVMHERGVGYRLTQPKSAT